MIIHPYLKVKFQNRESIYKLWHLIFEVQLSEMCPLRFILVFFSAALAGYLAWRTVSSLPPELEDSTHENMSTTARGKQGFGFVKVRRNDLIVSLRFFVFVLTFCNSWILDYSEWLLGFHWHGEWALPVEEHRTIEERRRGSKNALELGNQSWESCIQRHFSRYFSEIIFISITQDSTCKTCMIR